MDAVAGRGGMGVVYRAVSLRLGRTVALKVITPALAPDPEIRARFLRESQLAAGLDHPNVIPIYEAGEHEGTAYIAMRFVEGSDLARLLREHPEGLPPRLATDIVAQVAGALDAAHARALVHRDVKPANVLLADEAGTPHVYLTDFGLAKHDGSSMGLTQTGQWIGTPDFAAPEQIEGRRLDARADVYALACVLFTALTGRAPFTRESAMATAWAQVHEPAPSPRALRPDLPIAWDPFFARALAKRPGDRYASAGELARAARAAMRAGTGAPTGATAVLGDSSPADPLSPTAILPAGATVAAATPPPRGTAPTAVRPAPPRAPARAGALWAGSAAAPPAARPPVGPPPGPPGPPGAPAVGPPPDGGTPAARPRRRRWPWVVALLLVLGGAGAAAGLYLGGVVSRDDLRRLLRGDPAKPSTSQPAGRTPAAPTATTPPQPATPDGDAGTVRCTAATECRQGTAVVVAPPEGTDCRHDARPAMWRRLDATSDRPLFACVPAYPATAAGATVPELAGARLDRAGQVLDADGIPYDTDSDSAFGPVVSENWTVCSVRPSPGSPVPGGEDVILVVDRTC